MQQYWQQVVRWKGFTGTPGQRSLTMQMPERLRQLFPLLAGLTMPVTLLRPCHTRVSSFASYQAHLPNNLHPTQFIAVQSSYIVWGQ